MTTPSRARILGDVGPNASDRWTWGRTQPDAAALVYGVTQADVDALEQRLARAAVASGMPVAHRIPLKEVTDDKREAFGFIDGFPARDRGTYKSLRNADPIHLVEPGEFILGYPDNRGNIPPGPTLPATADPDNHLPLVGGSGNFAQTVVESDRYLGFNGSFLVIRQLEQDVAGFHAYCDKQAKTFATALPAPYQITRDFIAAKLIGRWPDGSSLLRYPYEPKWRRPTPKKPCGPKAILPARLRLTPHPSSSSHRRRRYAAAPTTISCLEPKTPKHCAARSARISAAPIRATA